MPFVGDLYVFLLSSFRGGRSSQDKGQYTWGAFRRAFPMSFQLVMTVYSSALTAERRPEIAQPFTVFS